MVVRVVFFSGRRYAPMRYVALTHPTRIDIDELCCVAHPVRICTDDVCCITRPTRMCIDESCSSSSQVSYGGKS